MKLATYLKVSMRTMESYVEQLVSVGSLVRDRDPMTGKRILWHRDLAPNELAGNRGDMRRPGPKPAHDDNVPLFSNREPEEWVRVSRRGRSRGFDVHVDARTLQSAGVPLDVLAERIRVRRHAAGRNRVVLEVKVLSEGDADAAP